MLHRGWNTILKAGLLQSPQVSDSVVGMFACELCGPSPIALTVSELIAGVCEPMQNQLGTRCEL